MSSSASSAAGTDVSASAHEMEKPPEAVQMTDDEELDAAAEKDNSDSGKLKTLMGVLKRMVGVKDMAAIRLSLPANLLEPVPNLEYWNYLDRGDIFASVGELPDPLDRMLQTLRFTLTKELKFVNGKVCKPYNSILGEHFRCHWDIAAMQSNEQATHLTPVGSTRVSKPTPLPLASAAPARVASRSSRPPSVRSVNSQAPPSQSAADDDAQQSQSQSQSPQEPTSSSPTSGGSKRAKLGLSRFMSKDKVQKSGSASTASASSTLAAPGSANGSAKGSLKSPVLSAQSSDVNQLSSATDRLSLSDSNRRICFLTEQVSHHPPISSFFVECKESGVQLCGVDQLSAKFTGTAIKVFPGEHNKGIFLKLTEDSPLGSSVAGEEYQITHPTASINGLLRGSLWVAICDTTYVTCRGGGGGGGGGSSSEASTPRLRTIIEYKDESWLMKAKYALEGVIYEHSGNEDTIEEYKSIKDVPQDKIVATIEGSWKGKITWKKRGDKESHLLINLDEIDPLPKTVRPLSSQETWESRRIWESVTSAIYAKEFSAATKNKQRIEQMQRDAAAERKRQGKDFQPTFFEEDITDGRPRLTSQGRHAIDAERDLKGYAQGQNVPEDTRDKMQKNSTLGRGESLGTPAEQRARDGGDKDSDDDDDDDDDAGSFTSAKDDDDGNGDAGRPS